MRRGFLGGAALLLALGGCATPSSRTGPATLAPYTVGDHTYVPLREWRGYTEDGLASWYGEPYRGKPTASGEPFDPRALTAAHPVLPMNVCVEVARAEPPEAVTVRINDRGPFQPGRVIDLSEAAAAALGIVSDGLAWVHVAAIAEADAGGRCPGPVDHRSALVPDDGGSGSDPPDR